VNRESVENGFGGQLVHNVTIPDLTIQRPSAPLLQIIYNFALEVCRRAENKPFPT
jgi:hypothetical protein